MASRNVVIDTCCTLNLLATQCEVQIVQSLGLHLLDTEQVCREPQVLWTPPDDDGIRFKKPASTHRLQAAGLLTTYSLDTDELLDAFVACAEHIKDTDASCIALAGVLGVPLVTDDRKERRIALEIFPKIELISTLDLLYGAAMALNWQDLALAQVVVSLRWGGNFAPPKRDPRGDWYLALLQRAGVPFL